MECDLQEPYRPGQAVRLIRHIDFQPSWFIDCGPGSGIEAEIILAAFPRIRVLGIEPSPIATLWQRERFPGRLIQAAAWSSDGFESLRGSHELLHSTVESAAENRNKLIVPCFKLDTLVPKFSIISENAILWCDTEGSEVHVLIGAERLLSEKFFRLINIEVRNENSNQVTRILSRHGFERVDKYLDQGAFWDEIWKLAG